MSDTETPMGGGDDAPLSMTEAISRLTGSETPEPSTEEVEQAEEVEEPEDGEPVDEDQTDDQVEDDGAEEDGQAEDEGEDDEPEQDFGQGRFASDDAKVRLDDGSTVTIAQLKQGTLLQSDYTRKTQAVAEERKAVEAHQQRVQQLEQTLSQQREYIQTIAQQILPQEPDPAMMASDPLGYMQAKADHDAWVKRINNIGAMSQQEQARRQAEAAEQARTHQSKEAQRLLEVMPELQEPTRYREFFSQASEVMASHYGFSAEEVAGAMDHRFYPIFRDLAAYQRIKANKPKVQQKTEGKPPVMKAGKRPSPEARKHQAVQAVSDRLSKTGSVKDGVALLLARQGQ